MLRLLVLPLAALTGAAGFVAYELVGNVFVNDDATLRIRQHTVHLYGIHVPTTEETCLMFVRPPLCGPRAAVHLRFRIGARFARCRVEGGRPEGGVIGRCYVDDEDLGAWLLRNGWAVALADAPVDYRALEEIAKRRGIGIWGIPVDRVRP